MLSVILVIGGGGSDACVGAGEARGPVDRYIGLYKILFYFESFVHESIVLSFFRPACIGHTVAILSHDYWAI